MCHTGSVAEQPTKREQARAETNQAILRVGRQQLGEVGAAALSLRAVARELGMVSSAIYRYVASRDELLTLLIDDAYNSLGVAVETSVGATPDEPPLERWVSAAVAIRGWALEHRNEYSLLYGSPVPGYAAPESTSISGTRASRALISIVADAARAKQLRRRRVASIEIPLALRQDFEVLRNEVALDVADAVVLDVLVAWSQLFGLLSFEMFGQTRGVVEDHAQLFELSVRRLAGILGLT